MLGIQDRAEPGAQVSGHVRTRCRIARTWAPGNDMRLAIATIAALIAAGCSTTPATVESARPVPADRIFETTSGESSVTFLRDSGGYGAACTHTVYVNNVRTFAMRSNESHMIRVPAGDYVFRLDTGGGLCPQCLDVTRRCDPGRPRSHLSGTAAVRWKLAAYPHRVTRARPARAGAKRLRAMRTVRHRRR